MRVLLIVTLWLAACTPQVPLLEKEEGGDWVEAGALEVLSLTGERRADRVFATALLGTRTGDQIELDIRLILDPPARFLSGSYQARMNSIESQGPLSSESVTFFGGQNTPPSVGGVFTFFSNSDGTRYRVRLPASAMTGPGS